MLAYFDASAGVSGDMLLGALVDAGLGLEGLRRELSGLGVGGYELSATQTRRADLRACRVQVEVVDDCAHARGIAEILGLIACADLPVPIKTTASTVFRRLGEAEARAHGAAVEDIHLHEIGAVDALVDVVGTVAGLSALGVERVVFSPLRLGFGTVHCAHGILPIPAPAVAELVKDVPVYAGDIEGEMVTPTGAALATTLAESFGPLPLMRPRAVGIGAGTAEWGSLPNVLRVFLGQTADAMQETVRELAVLEANIDDMNPEFYTHLCALLRTAGALDIWLIPLQMKKERPGTMLSVLVDPADAPALREIIFTESTTLGLREQRILRYELARAELLVAVEDLTVRVKVGRYRGCVVQVAPEYEDCRQVAIQLERPLKAIYLAAEQEAWRCLAEIGHARAKEENSRGTGH